jgi:hypothetical protein
MITRRSLGYAYVNFQQPADGKKQDYLPFLINRRNVQSAFRIRVQASNNDASMKKEIFILWRFSSEDLGLLLYHAVLRGILREKKVTDMKFLIIKKI